MKYTVKTTAGITFLFRSVSELEYNAEKSSLFVQLPGMKFTAHGVTSIKGEEDDEPWMNSFNIVGGGSGDGGFAEVEMPGFLSSSSGGVAPYSPSLESGLAQ